VLHLALWSSAVLSNLVSIKRRVYTVQAMAAAAVERPAAAPAAGQRFQGVQVSAERLLLHLLLGKEA
jgi:hypothetical protein